MFATYIYNVCGSRDKKPFTFNDLNIFKKRCCAVVFDVSWSFLSGGGRPSGEGLAVMEKVFSRTFEHPITGRKRHIAAYGADLDAAREYLRELSRGADRMDAPLYAACAEALCADDYEGERITWDDIAPLCDDDYEVQAAFEWITGDYDDTFSASDIVCALSDGEVLEQLPAFITQEVVEVLVAALYAHIEKSE